jgi:hypothetical protein
MTLRVINNPKFLAKTGFTKGQFRKLDDLYCRAASLKALNYRTVECDFGEEVASYTYHLSEHKPPFLQFIIRKVGPQTMMYELYKEGKGRIAKSGVFDYAYKKLQQEVESLF